MAVLRVAVRWVGFPGSPGFSNFHFAYDNEALTEIDASISKLRTMLGSIAAYIPTGVNLVYPTAVDVFNTGTGVLEESIPVTAVANTTGQAASTYAGPSGGVISWTTGVVNNGRRVRGRTFLVPLSTAYYSADGTPSDTPRAAVNTAATTFLGNASGLTFGIWSRPVAGVVTGILAPATSANVPETVAVLRSRRD